MTFAFTPATRQNVSLIIGVCGASGSGKTWSALAIATGLAGPTGKIAAIDTESGRMRHYAEQFKFDHGDLKPPFSPDRYIEAIEAADKAGYDVIVIDSLSHEWESEGGLQDMHDEILEQQVEQARKNHNGNWAFDENKTRERLSVGAWKIPKSRHKRFVSRLLQCRAHLVICMRADEKMRIETIEEEGSNGRKYKKTVIIQAKDLPPEERWSPITERRFPYELTLSVILTPQRPGFPVPVKLQEQHQKMVPLDRQLSVETGRALAAWARGGAAPASQRDHVTTSQPPADDAPQPLTREQITAQAAKAKAMGTDALRTFWGGLTPAEKKLAGGSEALTMWKADAELADQKRETEGAEQ